MLCEQLSAWKKQLVKRTVRRPAFFGCFPNCSVRGRTIGAGEEKVTGAGVKAGKKKKGTYAPFLARQAAKRPISFDFVTADWV